ncbi:Predicted lipid-binding transport protein, Tim44 family [Sphingomonas sp. OV641]|uniref:Tim44/TimA family putative adaptor protein n=1 Tax=Sphingomonas sp. OV641 TaxID=1881068 RepID=UPI0008D3ABE8|nr:Tim44/TimA family putative adaptor protein [Sphingomonas sp. OV641]SEJ31796.1 Predicted lipid-binding transport protein, Tim44 family [Sphingomonas sp. OV641]
MFYIVLLAMVAAFLALRLYSVLGKRTGHEPLPKPAEERPVPAPLPRAVEKTSEPREPVVKPFEGNAEPGVRAIIAVEPGFDVARFMDGAQGAYRMILESFWKGDEEALRDLVSPDVGRAFGEAIAQRNETGDVLDNRLVSIERAVITGASLQGKDARITVRFDALIAAVTRDAEGNVIAGSTSDAVETHDVWTFARTLRSSDPNWKLSDTDEA